MESKFRPTLQVGNDYTYLKLQGVLDEDNLLNTLLSQIQGRILIIDLAELDRINSCGVRDWVNWLNQIQALGLQVILLRCSASVVAQANMVANFAADAFIHSFYAPYVHPDTGEEQSVLLFTEDLRKMRPIVAPQIYAADGTELEFDEFEESYFAFVNDPRILNYTVPAYVQSIIQYFVPEAATHQPVIQSKSASKSMSAPLPMSVSAPMAGPASMSALTPISRVGGASTFGIRSVSGVAAGGINPAQNGFGGVSGIPKPTAGVNSGCGPVIGNAVTSPYASNAVNMQPPSVLPPKPQSAAPIVRHEQPPIPTAMGYQQLPQSPAAQVAPTPAPVQAAPVQAAPVQAAPVQAAPVQAAPVQTAPVQQNNLVSPAMPAMPAPAQQHNSKIIIGFVILLGVIVVVLIAILLNKILGQ